MNGRRMAVAVVSVAAAVLAGGCVTTFEAGDGSTTTLAPSRGVAPSAVPTTAAPRPVATAPRTPAAPAAPATRQPRAAVATAPVFPVTGRLLDADGSPTAAAPVRLVENEGVAEDVFAIVFTLGLACLLPDNPCRGAAETAEVGTTTRGDGTFRFDEAAVRQARGDSNGVVLSAGSEQTGRVRVELNPTVGGDLGDLPLWDANVRARTDGLETTVKVDAPPGADGRTQVHLAFVGSRNEVKLRATLTGSEVLGTFDRRAYEDGTGRLGLSAGFSRRRANQNARVDWTAAPVRVGPGAGAPLSRGKPCTIVVSRDAVPAGCPLTDGDLEKGVADMRTAVLDLGTARPLGRIAVRDRGESVEISTDGQTYTPVGEVVGGFGDRVIWPGSHFDADGAAGRFVRVNARGAAEVSVWPQDVGPAPAAAAPLPAAEVAAPGAAPGAAAPLPLPPLADPLDKREALGLVEKAGLLLVGLIATALLLVLASLTAVVAVRRRRRAA